ncbi:hypothetical protein V1477_020665 [Vespula maculifrons]|uniref:Uncharacterized protein n=2 Tax=Vespula TaxID=7451 RepID=A0A834KAS8_VESVU|nr:hypothetical protein HZH66_004774 [Vespula vulgaris]
MPDHDSCSVVRISTVSSGRGDICHLNTENQGSNSSQVSGSSRSFGGCKFGLALASQRTGLNESRKLYSYMNNQIEGTATMERNETMVYD